MNFKALLSTKTVLVLLVVFLVFLGNIKFQQWKAQRAIEIEKQNLYQQAQSYEKKNAELSKSLSYINTTDFKERVARQQLNLKKDGEVVYTFSDPKNTEEANGNQNKPQSNIQKWLNYFISSEQ